MNIPIESPVAIRVLAPMLDEQIVNDGIEIPAGASTGLIGVLNSRPTIEDGTYLKKSAPYYVIRIGSNDFEWHVGCLVKWDTSDRILIWQSATLDKFSKQIESAAIAESERLTSAKNESEENGPELRLRSEPRPESRETHQARVERLRNAIVDGLRLFADPVSTTSIQ